MDISAQVNKFTEETISYRKATVSVDDEVFTFTSGIHTDPEAGQRHLSGLREYEPAIRKQFDANDTAIKDRIYDTKLFKVVNRLGEGAVLGLAGGLISQMELSGQRNVLLEGAAGMFAVGLTVVNERLVKYHSETNQTTIDQLRERRVKLSGLLKLAAPRKMHTR